MAKTEKKKVTVNVMDIPGDGIQQESTAGSAQSTGGAVEPPAADRGKETVDHVPELPPWLAQDVRKRKNQAKNK